MGKLISIILLIIAALLGYFLYETVQNNIGDPIKLIERNYTPQIRENVLSYPDSSIQFYPNMRFNHNDITYKIHPGCGGAERERFTSAAVFLDDKATSLTISQNSWNSESDIEVLCGEEYLESKDLFVAGEGGPTFVLNTSLFTVILGGKVVLHKKSCGYNVELHELLHVFGFAHSPNKDSVMYNTSFCNQYLTSDIINELNRLYHIEPMPDLYFSKVDATKHGIYLDFNITVKNQGIIDSPGIKVTLLGDGKKIQNFSIGSVEYGAGRILTATNIKLDSRSTQRITFVIDPANEVSEYSEGNNQITLEVSE